MVPSCQMLGETHVKTYTLPVSLSLTHTHTRTRTHLHTVSQDSFIQHSFIKSYHLEILSNPELLSLTTTTELLGLSKLQREKIPKFKPALKVSYIYIAFNIIVICTDVSRVWR